MVDNRPDTRVSMRTPLARAKGLGAAGHGVEHWWLHRVTAVSNIPLVVSFVAIVATLGMALPIEDYVHQKGYKLAALIANNFFAAVIAVVCLYSILKISFGRV